MVRLLTDIVSYLDERLGDHRGRGPEYQYHCPACIDRTGGESSTPKLGINIKKAKGGCFRCGFGFRSFEQLFRYLNGGYVKIEEIALLRHEVPLPQGDVKQAVRAMLKPRDRAPRLRFQDLPPECQLLSDVPESERRDLPWRMAFDYIASRGVELSVIDRFNVGFCTTGEYFGYLIFPVIQEQEIVYWTSRFCGDRIDKSRNPPNVAGYHTRGTCLLNYDNVRGERRVALVEGPFSCMAFDHAVAAMGKYLTDEQVRLIAKLVDEGLEEIVIVLDPGTGVQVDAIYSSLLAVVPRVTVLPLEGGDPHDLRHALPELLATRRTPSVVDRVRQRFNA